LPTTFGDPIHVVFDLIAAPKIVECSKVWSGHLVQGGYTQGAGFLGT
jgi:hypothetical protein